MGEKKPAKQRMTIHQIHDALDVAGVSALDFWDYAMGGDRAELPRGVVRAMVKHILGNQDDFPRTASHQRSKRNARKE